MPYVILVIVFLLILLAVRWIIVTRNEFVRLKVKIEEAESGIDIALTKRYDVLTKLFQVTKGYAEHEKSILTETAALRAGASLKEKEEYNRELTEAFRRISVVAENYPQLTADRTFKELQMSISDVEEHLQASRRAYNGNVSMYNQKIASFPSNIIADSMNLSPAEFFQADEEKRSDVNMQF
jgi:LemA protein